MKAGGNGLRMTDTWTRSRNQRNQPIGPMQESARMRICFLAGTLEHGGAERQLFYMLQALCRGGVPARVLCFDQGEYWEAPIRSLGVPVTWIGQARSRLARLLRVLRELRNDPPDVFQSQHFFANAYVGLAGFLCRLPAIGAMRNEGSAELQSNGMIGGWLNLHAPPVIAANSWLAIKQAIARGVQRSRLHFLPNVVDTTRFKPNGDSVHRPLTLLAVGRITKQKRFDRFVSVLGRLRAELRREVRGCIVGPDQDHALRQQLESQAARLGLYPGYLEFRGGISDMGPVYQQADVCVLTSDYEGTPNVLLEAMASGLPVVATKVGGVPEIVRHGTTGFVIERDDARGLESALEQLISNASLRLGMGRRARDYVEDNHSLERLPQYLDNLYDFALPARRPWKLDAVESTPA
jgi:glycosyltransferase involved in cell wall biosynthesis